MQNRLKNEIKRLCKKALDKGHAEQQKSLQYREKFSKRTGLAAGASTPKCTVYPHKHFDPIYCKRHANFLAKSIWYKVLQNQYRPKPALNFFIPKANGSKRSLMSFSIPDTALANLVLKAARGRNLKRLSYNSYAYHPHLNLFDAIIALNSTIREEKVFSVEVDFEKYFDNLPTGYLVDCINNRDLLSLTPHERDIMTTFLKHRYAEPTSYSKGVYKKRLKCTPQGSSISLLLANIANHQLDRALEREAGRFVRFADDVVALCSNYQEAQRVENLFHAHCRSTGIKINQSKSRGIAILSQNGGEMRNFPHFDYLGYRFTKEGLTIPNKIVDRIKTRISRLVHIYLIHYPMKFNFNRTRVGKGYDWDLLGLVHEIRGYLYGGLTEKHLAELIHQGTRPPQMKGLMGFYALLEQSNTLRELDGWLVSSICRAMKKRQLILKKYTTHVAVPTKQELILGDWLDLNKWDGTNYPELKLPSFVRGWRAARKYYFTFGLEGVAPPNYHYS